MGEEEEAAMVKGGGEVPIAATIVGGVGWTVEPVHMCGAGGRRRCERTSE